MKMLAVGASKRGQVAAAAIVKWSRPENASFPSANQSVSRGGSLVTVLRRRGLQVTSRYFLLTLVTATQWPSKSHIMRAGVLD